MDASRPSSAHGRIRHAHLAMALASCAILLYEVAITRILSVLIWYHFAFLAISLAMLALSLPGVWFTFRPPGPRALRACLLASGVAVPASIAVLFKGSEVLPRLEDAFPALGVLLHAQMLLVLVALLIPLLFLGCAVCVLLREAEGRTIGRMYAADLLGAAVGALLVVPLMIVLPTPILVAAAGLLPLGAALLLGGGSRFSAPAIALGIVALIAWGEPLHLRVSKDYLESFPILFERWTPTARLSVYAGARDDGRTIGAGWGMGAKAGPASAEMLWMEQDGSAGTPITRLTGAPAALTHLLFDVTSVGYQLRPPARVCIVGAGGGRDILTALSVGARDVDAVELNAGIVRALEGPFRAYSGDVYRLPGVSAIVSEGRSFLTRSAGAYDLIQISLIDSWAATAAGAFSLSENYLYTVEGLRLYLQRTSARGMVSISRWMAGGRQMESARLARLATEALEQEGVRDPGAHIVVVSAGQVATFLLSRAPFDAAAIARVDEICAQRGFRRVWPRPAGAPGSLAAIVLAGGVGDSARLGIDLSSPTDDRPFFFQTVSLLRKVEPRLLASLSANERSVSLLRLLLTVMTALTLGLFLAPFAFARRVRFDRGAWIGSGYFVCIGLAFMLVEVPWMQRFVLYLGHPSYATTVVLAALLLGAGLGSAVASRVALARAALWAASVPVVVFAIDRSLGPVFAATLGWPFGARVITSLALLVPAGFLMGFAFPLGMIAFGDRSKPWYWAVNGAASVLASVLSVALSMIAGFATATRCGIVLYAVAVILFVVGVRRQLGRTGSQGALQGPAI